MGTSKNPHSVSPEVEAMLLEKQVHKECLERHRAKVAHI